ncbi:MAG TPA: O-antigen ligase family protein [Cellvibrionaceae bacterium]
MSEPHSPPDEFTAFKIKSMWSFFKSEHFAFWMACFYLFFEFVRPQSIFPQLDILPFAKLFLIGSLIGALMDSSVRWASSPANKWIIFYFLWLQLSTLAAYNREFSLLHFMDFFGWFVIYFLIANIINTEKRFYIIILIYIIAAGKIAIGTSKTWIMRGFAFADWGLMGPPGHFQNSGELAVLMVMLFPLCYYMFAYLKNKIALWEKLFLIVLWVAPILTVMGASSRGAQVALAGQLALMFRKNIFKIKPLIGIVILINALLFLLPEEQKARFNSAGEDGTSQQRLLYWKHGMTMIEENPILGVGFYNFIPYFTDNFSYDLFNRKSAQLPHNILIQVGTDAGFPAIFAFLAMIYFCISAPFRCKLVSPLLQRLGFGLGIGVVGFFIAGQFVTITYYPFIWIHMAFISALWNINSLARTRNKEQQRT